MPIITPFCGWRYDPGKVDPALVACPNRVAISDGVREGFYAMNPRNAVRIVSSRFFRYDAPQDNCLTRAASHLDAWRGDELLIQDRPSFYIYEQSVDVGGRNYSRKGILCRLKLGEWGEDNLFPLCETGRPLDTERLELMRALRGHVEPVPCVLTDGLGRAEKIVDGASGFRPAIAFVDGNGISHRLWVMDHAEQCRLLVNCAVEAKVLVAGATELFEAARCYRNEIREAMRSAGQIPPAMGDLYCDYVPALLVSDSDPGLTEWPMAETVENRDFISAVFREEYTRPPAEGEEEPVDEVCLRNFICPLMPAGMVFDLLW